MKLDFNIKYRDAVEDGSATVVTRDGRRAKDIKFNENEKTITATIGSDDSSFRSITASQNGLCRPDGWPTPDDLFIEFIPALPQKVAKMINDYCEKHPNEDNDALNDLCNDIYFLGECNGKLSQSKATMASDSSIEDTSSVQQYTAIHHDENFLIRSDNVDCIETISDIASLAEAPMKLAEKDEEVKGVWDINSIKTFDDLMLAAKNGLFPERNKDIQLCNEASLKLDSKGEKDVFDILHKGEESEAETENRICENILRSLDDLARLKGEYFFSHVEEINDYMELLKAPFVSDSKSNEKFSLANTILKDKMAEATIVVKDAHELSRSLYEKLKALEKKSNGTPSKEIDDLKIAEDRAATLFSKAFRVQDNLFRAITAWSIQFDLRHLPFGKEDKGTNQTNK